MGQAIIYGQTAAKGSISSGSTLTVIAEEGSIITVAKDDKSFTSTDNPAVFKKLEDGTWNATAEKEGTTPVSQDIELKTNYTLELMGKIYGISRDITASSPHWIRTHDAVGMNATASVGTVPGESDFDTIYPWSEIHRETLSTGDVMVYIPKFYYQRYREGNIEYINIADRALDGFSLHPLFDRPDRERDAAYVGAYETSYYNKSVSGVSQQASITRAEFRNSAREKGTGWGIIDLSAFSAIQMLILVEFATNDVQTAIGAGRVNASSGSGTGSCDSVPNLTGKSGLETVVYRGIENPWGNYLKFVDGLNWLTGDYYFCNDPSKYADGTSDGYQKLTYEGSIWNNVYITKVGLDENFSHIMLAEDANGGSASTYFCDSAWSATGWRVFAHGGYFANSTSAGLFTEHITYDGSGRDGVIGSRLLYLP